MYSLTGQDHLREEAELLHALGFDAEYTTNPQLPLPVADAVIYPDMAQFHPLQFLNAMTKGLRIYEHSFVTALDGTTAVTVHGRVHAKKVIVTTHFPFINRRGGYFLKLYQKRSYVIAYDHAPQIGCTAADAGDGCYFRNYQDLLLIGGGDHRTVEAAKDMRPQRPLHAPGSRACASGTAGRIRTVCRSTASPISAATAQVCRTYMSPPASIIGA